MFPDNNIIRVYNHFPRRYPGGVKDMIKDLERVRLMGFNAVWINPLQLTGDFVKKQGKKPVSGSLYAMASDTELNPTLFPGCDTNEKRESLLKTYTFEAKKQGLMPLFDLVLNHVGRAKTGSTTLQIKFKDFL